MSRTFQNISRIDLQEIRDHSLRELASFLNHAGNPSGKFRCYANRLIAICLGQGTAQHFIDLQGFQSFDNHVTVSPEKILEKGHRVLASGQVISGIKDIDVWFFFEHEDAVPIPNRRHCKRSWPAHFKNLGKRDLDFMKKGVAGDLVNQIPGRNPIAIVRSYLQNTPHGRDYLSRKSLVGLYPDSVFQQLFWATRRWAP